MYSVFASNTIFLVLLNIEDQMLYTFFLLLGAKEIC